MRKLAMVLGTLALMSTGLTSASASHPTQMCLDIDPDHASPMSNDDIVDSIWAYPGATDAGHPPQYGGCVTELVQPGQDWTGTQIDFEITGVADPDEPDSDSPRTPDMTCTVGEGAGGCAAYPPPSAGGEQTIRAWIDFDKDNATMDGVDTTEGPDEDTQGGTYGEPDMTDVALWTWTHGDPPPPCEGDCRHPTEVTLRYDGSDDRFHGRVTSRENGCMKRRSVELRRVREGPDLLVSSVATGWRGWWNVDLEQARPGTYRVTVTAIALPDGALCERAVSDRLRV